MGKNVDDTAAVFKACTACSRSCQTTHANGMPYSVPKFQKFIAEHSTPSSANCTLQVPAAFIRNHIGFGKKEQYILEGASGRVWVVTFLNVGFKTGWKEFAIDNQLEKGDGVTLSLIAPKRFHVSVFDKHGMEKVNTKPYRPRGMIYTSPSPSGMIYTTVPPSAAISKEHLVVSNSTSGGGGAEGQCTTPLREPPAEVPKDDCLGCALTAGRSGSHEKRTVLGHPLPHEPSVGHEVEQSDMSVSSDDSDDSIQVRLAKAVLAKAKEKKLKKRRKTSCTSAPPPVEPATAEGATTVAAEACKSLQKDDRTTSNDSPRHDGPGDGPEAVVEKPCEEEEPIALVFEANNIHPTGVITGAGVDEVVAPDVGQGRNELPTDQPEETLPEEEFPLPQKWIEEEIGEADTATGVTTGEGGLPLSGVEMSPVKLEPGLFADLGLASRVPYYQTVVGACCTVCGLRRELPNPVRPTRQPKAEPVTTTGFPERAPSPGVRSPSAENALDAWRRGRATEYQKQRAIAAANELSANITNPNALVLMRIGWTSESYDCFLSVKCSEMLPSVPMDIVVMDTEGRAQIAQWQPDQRYLTGPGWKEFVDSHNLYINDVCVLEVIDPSLQNFTVKLHILLAHEMERSPKPQTPPPEFVSAPVQQATTAGAAMTIPVPVVRTGAKTRSNNVLHSLVSPSKTRNKRTRTPTPNVDDGIHEIPRRSVDDDDDDRVGKYSPMKRLRRASSASPSTTPRTPRSSTPSEVEQPRPTSARKGKAKAAPKRQPIKPKATPAKKPAKAEVAKPAKKAAKAEVVTPAKAAATKPAAKAKGGAASRSASTSKAKTESPKNDNPKQVQTRNPERMFYKVAKMMDRRKSLEGVAFLVELADPVMIPRASKRMKAQPDEKGRWWVPHHHFSSDFASCYIE